MGEGLIGLLLTTSYLRVETIMARCGPGDIFVSTLFSLYVALHISAFAIGIHALQSPSNCGTEHGVGTDLAGK